MPKRKRCISYLLECSAWPIVFGFLDQNTLTQLLYLCATSFKKWSLYWKRNVIWKWSNILTTKNKEYVQHLSEFSGTSNDLTQFPHLQMLSFNPLFNSLIQFFPTTLKSISLGFLFDQDLPTLPTGLTALRLSDHFNHNISFLPNSLSRIIFGFAPKSLCNFPDTLQYLKLPSGYNSTLPPLPETLLYLNLGTQFNQPIFHLPKSLTKLILSTSFNHVLPPLPSTLVTMKFGSEFFCTLPEFPPSLSKLLICSRNDWILPPSLTSLTFDWKSGLNLPILPSGLIKLRIHTFTMLLPDLHSGLQELSLGYCFNRPLPPLPKSLILLETGWCFEQLLCLPKSLRHLECKGKMRVLTFPSTLTYLSFQYCDYRLPRLPRNLETLIIKYDYPITRRIPPNCRVLYH